MFCPPKLGMKSKAYRTPFALSSDMQQYKKKLYVKTDEVRTQQFSRQLEIS